MKRIFISIIFILTALIISAFEVGYINGKTDLYISKINQADKLMLKSDFEQAIKLCKENMNDWDEDTVKINYTQNHDYTEKISIRLSKMCSYAENGNPDLYFSESEAVKKELTFLKEGESPNLENLI